MARARSYENLFDAQTRFFQPRRADGSFDRVSDLAAVWMGSGAFTEGSAWHYRFYAPHDIEGLATLFGGPGPFGDALEQFFSRSALGRPGRVNLLLPDSYYWHGNEPDLGAAWMFYASSTPERRFHWVRQIQNRLYTSGPDGLAGNDDGGTLSAWYLFAALGLFPVAGTDSYIIGNPILPLAEVTLLDGTTLRIEAPGTGPEVEGYTGLTVNGEPWTVPTIRHAQLSGATLHFSESP